MFVGREYEMKLLRDFRKRRTAGLVVCRGRRRIGKSTLIEEFGKGKPFHEFYGLAPREGIRNADQLRHFGELMGTAFEAPAMRFDNWHEALSTLAGLTSGREAIILLDEISWIASKDKDFAGKLRGVWDTRFKQNDRLILILCGSGTSWIDDNILNDKGFMGRVSLVIRRLDIAPESILSAAPYFPRQTRRHAPCQIDLLIHTRNTLYVCEIKFRKRIEAGVCDEVLGKIAKLPGRTKYSVRPVLIYDGEFAPGIARSDVFCRLIPAVDLLAKP